MDQHEALLKELIATVRAWAAAREMCRRLADSKKTKPEEMERAKHRLIECSDKLAKVAAKLERTMKNNKPVKKGKPVDWHAFFGAVSVAAKALEAVVQPDVTSAYKPPPIIDTTGEEV